MKILENVIKFLNWSGFFKIRYSAVITRKIYEYLNKDNTPLMLRVNCNGNFYDVNFRDSFIAPGIISNHFETFETQVLKLLAEADKTFIDIGANIGYYALTFSKLFNKIYAFEPNIENYSSLINNVKQNNCHNIVPVNLALSDKFGELSLYLDADNIGGHSLSAKNIFNVSGEVKIKAIKLDDYVTQNNISVDFIKIDVQGHEEKVFLGAIKTLKQFRPTILMEFDPRLLNNFSTDPEKFLKSFIDDNYILFILDDRHNKIIQTKVPQEVIMQCKLAKSKFINLLLINEASRDQLLKIKKLI